MARLGTTAGQVEHRPGAAPPADARRALRESEERFRSAFESAAIGMALVSPDGRFLRVNRSLCEILGRSSDELLTLSFQQLTHPDDLLTDLEYVRRMLADEVRTYQMEKRYFHADGHVVWALLSVSLVRDELGEPRYFIAQVEDVSERKQAEETLLQRDAVFCAVASCAERLLRTDDWRDVVGEILRMLGEASQVSHAYLFRRHEDGAGRTLVSLLDEWSAPGVESRRDDPAFKNHLPVAMEARWLGQLESGRIVQAHVRELGPAERALLDEQGVCSLVLVPVVTAGECWGFLGFDECAREREWTAAETETLRTAAGILGAAIERRLGVQRQRESEERFRRSNEIVRATATGAQQLLKGERWSDAIDHLLASIGVAAEVSRTYVLQLEEADGRQLATQVAEWAAEGVSPLLGDPRAVRTPVEHFEALGEAIATGKATQRHVAELREPSRSALAARGIDSILLAPIVVDGHAWGFLGVDECRGRREWTTAEGEALRMAAGMIGAAIRRELAERDRREAEDRYRRLVETLPLTTYVDRVDDDVTSLFISPQIEAALGYTTEEWLSDPGFFRSVLHPDDRGDMLESAWPEGDGPHRAEYRMIARDGSVRWFLDEYTIHRDEAGRRTFAQGYLIDISERKEMEEELRRTNQLLQALIEASPIGILGIDLDGRVWLWNPAAEEMFGWSRDEVVGRPVPFVPAEKEAEFRSFLERAREGESWTNAELTRQRRDGSTIVIAASSAPVRGPDDSHRGLVSLVVDVTEQKRLQAQLLHASRLEAVGRLAGGVAHDFNNLLTAISGYGEFLLEALDEHDPLRRDVEEIRRAADLAAALVRQLLAFSRKQMLQPRTLDLNAVVRETESLLKRLIGEDVELQTALDDDVPPIRADPAQIEQIIVNLAVNARDAMPEGGRLVIRTQAGADGSRARLMVSDTGCGMDEHTRLHAFEPFFTTKDPAHGTGLGLSMVFGIVTQSGGTVEVESDVGKGTTFVVELPAELAPSGREAPERALPSVARAAETVLLVEDEEIVRALAERVLSNAGYEVLVAATGAEAIALAESEETTIDLLLIDVVMPGMSGPEVANSLTALRPGLRVLYTSGYAEEDVWTNGGNGHGFIAKPFTPDLLRRKVAEVLQSSPR